MLDNSVCCAVLCGYVSIKDVVEEAIVLTVTRIFRFEYAHRLPEHEGKETYGE